MGQLVLLNQSVHKNLRVNPDKVEAHGAHERSVPVVLSEFLKLAVQYPIVITKNSETGKFLCVAIFGFEKGENLFWKSGAWDAIYLPLNIARQPFFVGKDDEHDRKDSRDNFVICVDEQSECLQQGEGERLFDEEGKETPYLENMKSILAALLTGETQTQTFVNKLLALDILMPMSLDITFVNEESQQVEGTYTIDEEKLKNLSRESLLELHSLGYLSPVYTMITSLGQFFSLVNRKNAMLTKGNQWFQKADAQ